jgi:hypothetical protein
MLIEFAPFATAPHESSYRIKNWRIELKGCQEFISKDINVVSNVTTQNKITLKDQV